MSTSAPSRVPLAALPLSRFIPAANTLPSPISLPTKRNAATMSAETEGKRTRKVSRMDEEGSETIKRSRVKEVTPKAKAVLERDDLGVGRSPARRLFGDDESGGFLGISGAVPTYPSRSLASSPPLPSPSSAYCTSDTSSPGPSTYPFPSSDNENGADVDHHDPGFIIFADDTDTQPRLGVGIGTPKSRKASALTVSIPINTYNALDALIDIPSSPASSSRSTRSTGTLFDEDQENIPPPYSITNTPSKRSAHDTPSRSGSSVYDADDEPYLSSGGSGRRRARILERSRLGLESVLRGEVQGQEDEDEDELTPGRREVKEKMKGKARLAIEVDRA